MRTHRRSIYLFVSCLVVMAVGCSTCPDFPAPTDCQHAQCVAALNRCAPMAGACGSCCDPCAKNPCPCPNPCGPKQTIQVRSLPGLCLDICGAPCFDMCTGPCPEITGGPDYYYKLPIGSKWYARWVTPSGDCVYGRIEVGEWSYQDFCEYVHQAQIIIPLTDVDLHQILDRQAVITKVILLPKHMKMDCLRSSVDKIVQMRSLYGDQLQMDMSDTLRRNWSFPVRSEWCTIAAFGGNPSTLRPEFIDQLVAWKDAYLVDLMKSPQGRTAGWWVWNAQNYYLDDIDKRAPGPGEAATVGKLPPAADVCKVADMIGTRLVTVRLGPAQHPF